MIEEAAHVATLPAVLTGRRQMTLVRSVIEDAELDAYYGRYRFADGWSCDAERLQCRRNLVFDNVGGKVGCGMRIFFGKQPSYTRARVFATKKQPDVDVPDKIKCMGNVPRGQGVDAHGFRSCKCSSAQLA